MSDPLDPRHAAAPAPRSHRGQSLVEFALVLPMLIVLLLGIADFARIFSAGVVLEASTRNAAEIGAIERLRNKPPSAADPTYYEGLHATAAAAACEESRQLPTFGAGDSCPSGARDGDGAASWFVRVCVHDGADPICGVPPTGYAAAPNDVCPDFESAMTNVVPDGALSYFVEVRTCYKFETIFDLDLALPMNAGLSLGDIWLERRRTFVVDCPVGVNPADVATNCPNP